MRQVLLFGTSGNPPTGRDGHSGMVDYFVTLGVSQMCLIIYQHYSMVHSSEQRPRRLTLLYCTQSTLLFVAVVNVFVVADSVQSSLVLHTLYSSQ